MRDNNNKFNKGSRRDSGRPRFDSRDSRPHQMHDAVCSDCKGDCKVPFMPSSGKPIYCSNCFEKRGNGNNNSKRPSFSRNSSYSRDSKPEVNFNKQFDILSKKLDKIMEALNISN